MMSASTCSESRALISASSTLRVLSIFVVVLPSSSHAATAVVHRDPFRCPAEPVLPAAGTLASRALLDCDFNS